MDWPCCCNNVDMFCSAAAGELETKKPCRCVYGQGVPLNRINLGKETEMLQILGPKLPIDEAILPLAFVIACCLAWLEQSKRCIRTKYSYEWR